MAVELVTGVAKNRADSFFTIGFLSSSVSEQIWEFEVQGGGVLVRPDVKGLFLLNPTAFEIWVRFRQGSSPEAIAGCLAHTYGISCERALRDVEATVQDWQQTLLSGSTPVDVHPSRDCPPVDREIVLNCRLNGTSFNILLSSDDLAEEIIPRLESLRIPACDSVDFTLRLVQSDKCVYIFRGDELLSVQEDAADARIILLEEIVRLSAPDRGFLAILHAGACGSDSKCVIFPATTHSGKTTLAAVLMASGLTLYADDSTGIQRDNLKIPAMPFALMIREGSWAVVSARFPAFESLPTCNRYGQNVKFLQPGGDFSGSVARASAIAFSRWEAGATTRLKPLTTFEALVRLKESGFWLAHDRRDIQKFLDWLQALPIYDMVYSDVDEAATAIKRLLNE